MPPTKKRMKKVDHEGTAEKRILPKRFKSANSSTCSNGGSLPPPPSEGVVGSVENADPVTALTCLYCRAQISYDDTPPSTYLKHLSESLCSEFHGKKTIWINFTRSFVLLKNSGPEKPRDFKHDAYILFPCFVKFPPNPCNAKFCLVTSAQPKVFDRL